MYRKVKYLDGELWWLFLFFCFLLAYSGFRVLASDCSRGLSCGRLCSLTRVGVWCCRQPWPLAVWVKWATWLVGWDATAGIPQPPPSTTSTRWNSRWCLSAAVSVLIILFDLDGMSFIYFFFSFFSILA